MDAMGLCRNLVKKACLKLFEYKNKGNKRLARNDLFRLRVLTGAASLEEKKVFQRFTLESKSNREFGERILDLANAFFERKGAMADPRAYRKILGNIREGRQDLLKYYIDLLTAFTPDYKKQLYLYYRNQQYVMLHRFLSYPFLNPDFLTKRVKPFKMGISKLNSLRVLDYGCGLPFGVIDSLLCSPESIESVTLIDLDLVHLDFAEFAIKEIAPDVNLTVHRLTDADSFPTLTGRYNFIYGGDVFEHLRDPEEKLRVLLENVDPTPSICFFDFCEHDNSYQHITPDTSRLSDIVQEFGFRPKSDFLGITEFRKE